MNFKNIIGIARCFEHLPVYCFEKSRFISSFNNINTPKVFLKGRIGHGISIFLSTQGQNCMVYLMTQLCSICFPCFD